MSDIWAAGLVQGRPLIMWAVVGFGPIMQRAAR
jgi:hypothetical protein